VLGVVCRMRGCPVVVYTHGGKPLPVKVKAFSLANETSNDILCKIELSRKMYFLVSTAILRTQQPGRLFERTGARHVRGAYRKPQGPFTGMADSQGTFVWQRPQPAIATPYSWFLTGKITLS
jgi:hypothetical protein